MHTLRLLTGRLVYAAAVFVTSGLLVSLALALAPDNDRGSSTLDLFLRYSRQFLTLDFAGSDALEIGAQSARLTFYLVAGAIILTTLIGVGLGLAGGRAYRGSVVGYVTRFFEAICAAPVLVVALVFVLISTEILGVMPEFSLVREGSFAQALIAYLMPVLALTFGDGLVADVARSTEIRVRQVREEDYIRALRAKGVPTLKHYLRSLAPSIAGLIANKITLLLSAAVVVEYVFNWKGLGYAVVFALQRSKDYEVVLFVTMIMVVVVLLASLTVSVIADVSDPRVRDREASN